MFSGKNIDYWWQSFAAQSVAVQRRVSSYDERILKQPQQNNYNSGLIILRPLIAHIDTSIGSNGISTTNTTDDTINLTYSVLPNHTSTHLDYISTTALIGNITNDSGEGINFNLPNLNTSNSLGAKDFQTKPINFPIPKINNKYIVTENISISSLIIKKNETMIIKENVTLTIEDNAALILSKGTIRSDSSNSTPAILHVKGSISKIGNGNIILEAAGSGESKGLIYIGTDGTAGDTTRSNFASTFNGIVVNDLKPEVTVKRIVQHKSGWSSTTSYSDFHILDNTEEIYLKVEFNNEIPEKISSLYNKNLLALSNVVNKSNDLKIYLESVDDQPGTIYDSDANKSFMFKFVNINDNTLKTDQSIRLTKIKVFNDIAYPVDTNFIFPDGYTQVIDKRFDIFGLDSILIPQGINLQNHSGEVTKIKVEPDITVEEEGNIININLTEDNKNSEVGPDRYSDTTSTR